MQELEMALRIVREHDRDSHFAGRRQPEVVASAEKALGLRFPPTYRRFVEELGAGRIGSAEFYGVIDQDFEDSAIPDGIWLTLDERARAQLPTNLIVVGETGDGRWLALDASKKSGDGEFPVVAWAAPEPAGPPMQEIAPDFGSLFLDGVQRAVRRIVQT